MAYVPPHKRHSKDSPPPKPSPFSSSQPKRTLNPRDQKPKSPSSRANKVAYAPSSISRWFAAGSAGEDPIPPSVRLAPFDCEVLEARNGGKPMVLEGEEGGEVEGEPWVKIADKIMPDLIGSFRTATPGLESERVVVKPSFVARIGKVLFLGNSVGLENIRKAAAAEIDSRQQIHKSFYTNVPCAYMEDTAHLVANVIGFDFDYEKDDYTVKVFDKFQPESITICKCVLNDSGALEIRKIELNNVRHLVADISCLYKDLDLRLMLVTKRRIKSLDDEESEGINKLLKSAIIDPDVRGGLRWPLGEEHVADRFSVVGAWYTKFKVFKNQSMRIKLRYADRFDHTTSTGEVSSEVALKLTEISKHVKEGNMEIGREMVQDAVKMIWDHFLSYNHASK